MKLTTKLLGIIGMTLVALVANRAALVAEADYFMGTEIGSSARFIRMGSVEGFSSESDGVFENPAGLFRMGPTSVSFFSTQLMGEVDYYNVAFGGSSPVGGSLAFGFNTVRVPALYRTELVNSGTELEDLNIVGNFEVSKSVYKIGYSFAQSKNVHFGFSGSYYDTVIGDVRGSGYNLDAGIVFDADRFGVGVLLRNLATGLKVQYSNGTSEVMPMETVVATRIGLGDFDVLGQMKIIGTSKKLAKSAGLNYTPWFIPFIKVSGGYKEFPVLNEIRSKVSIGIGMDLFGNTFDYAYQHSDHPEYSGIHYFSVSLNL